MASLDSYNNVYGVVATPFAANAAGTVGATVDMLGYESVTFFLATGAVTDGTWDGVVQESDQANAGFVDAVTVNNQEKVIGPLPHFTNANSNAVYRVGYVGNKRYVRLNVTETVNGTAVFGVIAVKGDPRVAPTPVQVNA